jgi:hypothetical protein
MKIAIDQAGEIVLAIDVDQEIEVMTGIIAEKVAREIIEAGEMIPATGPGGEQTILLT